MERGDGRVRADIGGAQLQQMAAQPAQRWRACAAAFDTSNFVAVVMAHLTQLPGLALMADEAGITMLHYAAAKGDHSLIQALLEAGADKSARNSLGDTPRDDAVTFDQREVVHLL